MSQISVSERRDRITQALKAGAQTLHALSGMLERDQTSIWIDLDRMRNEGLVVCEVADKKHRSNGRPVARWRLVASP